MCGERLPERSKNGSSVTSMPSPNRSRTSDVRTEDTIRATEADRRERIAEHDPEPVAPSMRHREANDDPIRELKTIRNVEPVRESRTVASTASGVNRSSNALKREIEPDYVPESAMPPAVANFYAQRMESSTPIEQPTTLSGPSFLGLSSSPANGDSSYSYLYEEEQPKSHAGVIVFLLVLAILAGVVYWKWQPIHDFVVNTALSNSNSGRPSPTQGTNPETTASTPGTTTATTDQNVSPSASTPQNNAAGAQKPDQPKIDTTQPNSEAKPDKSGADKTDTPKDERPQAEVGQKSRFQDVKGKSDEASEDNGAKDTEDAKPTSAKRTAPSQPAGTELVANGEKYLYGKGVPRNCGQAVSAFDQAAKQQNPSAMSHLGALYATGECVPFDRVRAYQWFSKALAQNRSNTYIEHNLNMLWREMTPREQSQVTGKKMF